MKRVCALRFNAGKEKMSHRVSRVKPMKTRKAFIKINGEIGEKEIPGIEYIDKSYMCNLEKRKNTILDVLSKGKSDTEVSASMETKLIRTDPIIVHHIVSSFSDEEDTAKGVKQAVELITDITKENTTINLLIDFSKADVHSSHKLSAQKIWDVGFKENKEIRRHLLKVATVAIDSPKYRAEKEFMESETHRFFINFQEALNWLKSRT
jgi:hypothetical protein